MNHEMIHKYAMLHYQYCYDDLNNPAALKPSRPAIPRWENATQAMLGLLCQMTFEQSLKPKSLEIINKVHFNTCFKNLADWDDCLNVSMVNIPEKINKKKVNQIDRR